MAHDVFISYSHHDKSAADAACSIMEKNGIRCWMAPRDINPGTPFAEAIIDGIKGSKVFVLVYSSNSNQSAQVIKEVDRAVHHGLAIIPIRLDDAPMSKQLEYYVSDVHWLDALTPPLEKHINRLCKVVQMLLKIDEVGSEDIEEAFRDDVMDREESGKTGRKYSLSGILIPVISVILIAVLFGAVSYFKRQAKVRWAREVAIPEIGRLIEENDVWRNLVAPYRLAEKVEAILGEDPELEQLFSQISLEINVLTDPPGARVYMKEYADNSGEWADIGVTPLEKIRVPIGIFRWRFEKEGYDTVLAASSTWDLGGQQNKPGVVRAYTISRSLDKLGNLPSGMVRVPATETDIGRLGDFLIGRFEVTNREYKAFIDAGGYRNREYWKHLFIKDGKELSWNAAMTEFVDQSGQPGPSTWMGGDFPGGEADYPVSGVSWYEADAYSEYKGMTLPTTHHWNVARGGMTPMIRVFQLGGFAVLAPFSNFGGKGPVAVGSLSGITAYGAYDMSGNVREWCWNESEAGRVIRGGSWADNTYEFGNVRQAPAMDRSSRNGIRLASYPDPDSIPSAAFAKWLPQVTNNTIIQKPVPDAVFRIYKDLFAYDKTELNSTIESREESPGGWIREKISFDAAYGGERVYAYLFLPLNVNPPYQTVIYFPGSAVTRMTSSGEIENYYEFTLFLNFLIRNGRAVLFPVYKGTFERADPALAAIHIAADSHAYTEFLVQMVKDFRRSVDYLCSRTDIDSSKVAFYGMSWGGMVGPVITAVEKRLSVSILVAGSFSPRPARPEANAINYVTRINMPTLMLNGKYDVGIDDRIKPLYELIGTPKEDKQLILYETDHIPPRAGYIKEILAWLDKYLGPVKPVSGK